MGLLAPTDWHACWIAADPEIIRRDPAAVASTPTEPGTPGLFRRAFDVPGLVKRATVYASARGLFELHLNGRRVGDDLFAPEWTDYDKRIQYRTYDVTAMLAEGHNARGAVLGDGWWSGYVGWQTRGRYGSLENSLLVQLEVELAKDSALGFQWQAVQAPGSRANFASGSSTTVTTTAPGLLSGNPRFFFIQLGAVLFSSIWAFVFTLGMLWLIDRITPVKVAEGAEEIGLDEALHGETAYIEAL